MSNLPPIPKGTPVEGNILKEMDRRFLSSLDLLGRGVVTLTIDRVEKVAKLVFGNGNKEENALLLYFKETPKPLLIKTTNVKAIVSLLGTNIVSKWCGEKVRLTVQNINAFGKTRPAVRIIERG